MPLKTLVKVGSVTNLSDARYCAGMGVEMIGFQVIPGMPAFIPSDKYQEIRGWISGPTIVAEVHGIKDPAMISQVLEEYKPDYFELGVDDLSVVKSFPIPFIVVLEAGQVLPSLPAPPIYVQSRDLTSLPAGTQALIEVRSGDEAITAINHDHVAGIATHGSTEERPGFKDYDALASILEVLEED